jgi:hypothetical protein
MSTRIAAEHPEWLFVSPTGQPQIYNTLYSACPSREYYQERSLDILDEIIARYPVDGFFFNWFGFSERDYSRVYHGVCHCPQCQAGFAEFSGGSDLPDGPSHPNYPEWLQFSNGVIRALASKISNHIFSRRPDAALVLSRGAPVIYYEANNAFGRELWHHSTAEAVSAHVTGLPEIALMVNSVSFVDMPYRMAGEQPEHFAQYLLQAIARGGNPSTYIMGAPGRIPYANLPIAGDIARHFARHRDVYADLAPSATIALARPDHLRSASPGYDESVAEFRGLYSSLVEKHIAFDVIGAEFVAKMAAENNLGRYQLVILPDLGELGSEAADALDVFVRNGGNVVLTGSSGISFSGGVELATAPAVMRVGNTVAGEDLWATYVTDNEQEEASYYRYAPAVVPVYGTYDRFVWKPAAEKRGMLLPQAPFGPPEKCYGHAGSADPSSVRYTSGAGTVVQFPWTIGHTYREFGTTEVRDYFLRTIEGLFSTALRAELPEQVELIASRSAGNLVIHLINQTGARRKSFGPHTSITGGQIRISGAGDGARSLVSSTALTTRREGEDLVIELPTLELFDVLVVPLGQQANDA